MIVGFYHFKPKTEFHLHSFFLEKGKIVKSFRTLFVNFGHGASSMIFVTSLRVRVRVLGTGKLVQSLCCGFALKLLSQVNQMILEHFQGRHTVGQDRQKCKETSNLDVIVMDMNTT